MAKVAIIDCNPNGDGVAGLVADSLATAPGVDECLLVQQAPDGWNALMGDGELETVVLFPLLAASSPDLAAVRVLFESIGRTGLNLVVVSSAEVYGARPQNPGFIDESRPSSQNGRDWYGSPNRLSSAWLALEELVEPLQERESGRVAILRCAAVLAANSRRYFSTLFRGRVAFTLSGHDPSLQLVAPQDVAQAVRLAVEKPAVGVYNVAGDGVVPLRYGLRMAKTIRLPVPRWIQRLVRPVTSPLRLGHAADQLEFIRYSWTISNRKIKRELGFEPASTSIQTLTELIARRRGSPIAGRSEFDDFGMDESYIASYGRTLLAFLEKVFWRIEVRGLEHVPSQGRAILAGVHRGFMPWDAVMAFHVVVKGTGRYPRFLIHPTLVKFPFQYNFITKLGGVVAGRQNADRVLQDDQLLGFYPEGIHGAFTMYKQAYGLGKFGRNEFVKTALRNRAPIVPFVTVGSQEIFPIIGRINWPWWKRLTQWPFFPMAPPFPLLPLPLPSKWHTQFLEPIQTTDYDPDAADDPHTVAGISNQVRDSMQKAVDEMRRRRRSVFFGSVFEGAAA